MERPRRREGTGGDRIFTPEPRRTRRAESASTRRRCPPLAVASERRGSNGGRSTGGQSVAALYNGAFDNYGVAQFRELLVGEVRNSMARVFGDLMLSGLGNPLSEGTFYFDKGISKDFPYMNLSGGEKAAFDLLLDMIVKRQAYDDTVYCIDEPELHLNARLQGKLLGELFALVPGKCQLWIATHSIGMMRKARDLQQANPERVVFLDFDGHEFDARVILRPKVADRAFWGRTLDVALGDLAELVAPRQIVLCEGRSAKFAGDAKAEFDARCYRIIFAEEYPETDFVSVGGCGEVKSDTLQLGKAIQTVVSGTQSTSSRRWRRLYEHRDCGASRRRSACPFAPGSGIVPSR